MVDKNYKCVGLITVSDIVKSARFPSATKDSKGRLRVAAAVGVSEEDFSRTQRLINAGADVIVVDTAHGHSKRVLDFIVKIRSLYKKINIIGGNIATAEAAADLIKS